MKRLARFGMRSLIILVSVLIGLGIAEIAIRALYLDHPFTDWRNFATEPVNQQATNVAILYDPVIGYIARPGWRNGTTNTQGKWGVRLNETLKHGAPLPPIPTGGILASGDSFTYGSEVSDTESWPAQLEKLLDVSVVNAGGGGYGVDQAVLRAEQLLDVVKPKVVIVSFIPNNMGRNEYSVNSGLPKPYFDVVNGKLELKNTPVPLYRPPMKHVGVIRAIFGYSYALYWAADRLNLKGKLLARKFELRQAHNKGVEVSCLLWPRLKEKVAGRGITLVALAQYAGVQVNGQDNSRKIFQVEKVLDCARREGYIVVDTYDALRLAFEKDPVAFWENWVKQPYDREWHTGHPSAEGHRLTAELIARALRDANAVPSAESTKMP